ncbi:hypothetical protein X801_02125 [Opisthorchis viverrini]|uniref:Uncharacterized protein n=1 Tax=Opisthorchis viverrini TaxID=6198 RepID=A0A1S8X5N0_OPIVI|nr:hypothetical protein X801_02125 [Opisthorchis viverrini]
MESAQNKGSSILPREEQVSEEFVINGKRYRQTYRRKVVLERRTTRDKTTLSTQFCVLPTKAMY